MKTLRAIRRGLIQASTVLRSAVIGGYLYRGSAVPALRDRYVFGDYSSRTADAPQGTLFVIGRNPRIEQLVAADRHPFDLALRGFDEDAQGELDVLANETGTLLGNSGVVMKLARSR